MKIWMGYVLLRWYELMKTRLGAGARKSVHTMRSMPGRCSMSPPTQRFEQRVYPSTIAAAAEQLAQSVRAPEGR